MIVQEYGPADFEHVALGGEPCPECDGEEQEAERDQSAEYSTPCHLCNGTGRV